MSDKEEWVSSGRAKSTPIKEWVGRGRHLLPDLSHHMDKPITEDKIEEGYGLVYLIIKKYTGMIDISFDWDDLFQLGCIGLLDAIRRYNPDRGMKFSSYACARIRYALLDRCKMLGHAKRKPKVSVTNFSEYQPAVGMDQVILEIPDREHKDYSLPEELDLLNWCPRIKKIITMYLEYNSFRAIGKHFGFSEARAHQLYRKGLELLMKEIKKVA